MRDHNSLTRTMGASYDAFLMDLESLTGFSFSRERLRVKRILATSGTRGLLAFLQKHHLILLEWFQTECISAKDVSHDTLGVPLFLCDLWKQLNSESSVDSVTHLRQAMCLFRKWGEEGVDPADDIEKFRARMLNQNQHSLSTIDAIARHLPAILGDEDIREDDHVWVKVTSGARALPVPILCRLDTISYSGLRIRHARDGLNVVSKNVRNRMVAVPKDWSKNRLVFAEPSASMNLQQVLRTWMEERVVHRRARRISWEDQTAQHRSLKKDRRASIDLSDASDYLSSGVIWRFLRGYPCLRSALFWARSSKTRIGSSDLVLRCFGTMGNATTFTVMSIFLACLTREAEQHCYEYTGVRPRVSTVFGDDVVCDDFVAGTVLSMITDVGLRPNRSKTFIGTRFRETCGLDLFDGQDCTPVYIKHVRVHCKDDVIRCVQQSNALFKRGYWRLANQISGLTGRSLSVNVDEASLISFSAGRSTVGCNWNSNLQRYESRYIPRRSSRTVDRDSHLDLQYALYHGSRIRDVR